MLVQVGQSWGTDLGLVLSPKRTFQEGQSLKDHLDLNGVRVPEGRDVTEVADEEQLNRRRIEFQTTRAGLQPGETFLFPVGEQIQFQVSKCDEILGAIRDNPATTWALTKKNETEHYFRRMWTDENRQKGDTIPFHVVQIGTERQYPHSDFRSQMILTALTECNTPYYELISYAKGGGCLVFLPKNIVEEHATLCPNPKALKLGFAKAHPHECTTPNPFMSW